MNSAEKGEPSGLVAGRVRGNRQPETEVQERRGPDSDLFEEAGPPPTPFHGGFGLLNRDGIRKPAYFAYEYLNLLRGREIRTSDPWALAATPGKRTGVPFWRSVRPEKKTSDRPVFTKVLPPEPAAPAVVQLSHLAARAYRLTIRRTGFNAYDPQTSYLEVGFPAALSTEQLQELQRLTRDVPERTETIRVGGCGRFRTREPMRGGDVVLLLIEPIGQRKRN